MAERHTAVRVLSSRGVIRFVGGFGRQIEMLAKYTKLPSKKDREASGGKASMMQHYLVSYALLGRQLPLTAGPDGLRHGDLEFAVMAFDEDGNSLDGIRTKVQEVIQPERYEQIHKGAYELLQRIEVPVTSASLRIGVRDNQTEQVGSMELRLPLTSAQ